MDHSHPVSSSATSRVTVRNRLRVMRQSFRRRPLAWAGAALLVTTLIYTLVWLALMATALLGTRADAAELSASRRESPATITSDKLNRVSASFRSLHSNLTRIKQHSSPSTMGRAAGNGSSRSIKTKSSRWRISATHSASVVSHSVRRFVRGMDRCDGTPCTLVDLDEAGVGAVGRVALLESLPCGSAHLGEQALVRHEMT